MWVVYIYIYVLAEGNMVHEHILLRLVHTASKPDRNGSICIGNASTLLTGSIRIDMATRTCVQLIVRN